MDYGVCFHGHSAMELSGGYSLGSGEWADFPVLIGYGLS